MDHKKVDAATTSMGYAEATANHYQETGRERQRPVNETCPSNDKAETLTREFNAVKT